MTTAFSILSLSFIKLKESSNDDADNVPSGKFIVAHS